MVNKDRTLVILLRGDPVTDVLLGYKKRGYGIGKFSGFGGKVEAGETAADAAARELKEETSIQVSTTDLQNIGRIWFEFPFKPEWTQKVHVFRATRWRGEAIETSEMIPQWFRLDQVPYEKMWQDGKFWLPPILAGETIRARFVFREDNDTLEKVLLKD